GLYFIGGLALAGVPPLNGFISKLALAQSGVEANDWVTLGLIVGASILTLIYMSRTWQHIFQRAPEEGVKAKPTGDSQLAPALLIAGCVFLGFYAQPLLDLATRAVTQIGNPQVYIQAVFGG
ncbi:MAG: Na+/H+ antiporter subunit D, partial [Anaerolineae bacterium]|nr:Na+/H+ antiporter subunit D [Anaerolineae bacterium]